LTTELEGASSGEGVRLREDCGRDLRLKVNGTGAVLGGVEVEGVGSTGSDMIVVDVTGVTRIPGYVATGLQVDIV
jgi:hypothetical protein